MGILNVTISGGTFIGWHSMRVVLLQIYYRVRNRKKHEKQSASVRVLNESRETCFFYRANQLCYRGLGDRNSVCLSVRPSVCLCVRHTRALWRNERTYCRYFDITWKSNHSSFLTPTEVGGRCPISPEILAQNDSLPPPFEKRRLRPISAYNV